MMKKFLILIFVGLIGFFAFKRYYPTLHDYFYKSLCDEPIAYKIGKIDSGFQMSEEDFKNKVEEATQIWEESYGKNLFEHDPNSYLEINLIFDERQMGLSEVERTEEQIEIQKKSLKEKEEEYNKKVAELEKQIEELNKEIDYWNSKGGAPEKEYISLKNLQNKLTEEAKELNDYASKINLVADTVNENINSLNEKVSNLNSLISQKPDVGYYISGEEEINVYFYSDENYLINILAHELGHSLGLDHIEKENAIMNPFVSEKTTLTQEDIDYIKSFCERNTRAGLIKEKINQVITGLKSKIDGYVNNNSPEYRQSLNLTKFDLNFL